MKVNKTKNMILGMVYFISMNIVIWLAFWFDTIIRKWMEFPLVITTIFISITFLIFGIIEIGENLD